ncbi:hypothetical protein RM844_24120 [Streptomyces sp. DSM 44915]|uniref:Uncharacterized protein n=1 Tax=Streptomyces chisholmiae TaxID=3075540 RepID=A0ABU2JWN9_9ACTN|nr:hypothetical protein [Streptomyces sp. DSM 44915]MDT0269375.1 hypothetical protein [Streptomyces sp. DSM 44915]
MERDGQLELYDRVAARLKDAHQTVGGLQVPEDVRRALLRKLLVITAATKQDLPGAARRLERLMADVEAGRLPSDITGGRDGTP